MGMTKAEVRRVVGEAERREFTSPWGDATDRPGECWLWGRDRLKPDAYVCFGGFDPRVSHKNP